MEKERMKIPSQVENQKKIIEECESDIVHYSRWKELNPISADVKAKKVEAQKRKELREYIHTSLMGYILETKEKMLMTYRGFDIIFPANMTREKPFIWLKRNGRYFVELGDTDVGNLIRIDNFLNELQTHLNKLQKGLSKLYEKEHQLTEELKKNESYVDEIEACRKKLGAIDKKLGVNKNERY